jgi:hypothetical protein
MLSIQQIQLNTVRAYSAHIKALYPNEEDGADRLLMVLRIYEWHLVRYQTNLPATLDQLGTLKHGIRQGELLLLDIQENEPELMEGWRVGCTSTNEAQFLANLLWELIMSLTQEIVHTEELHPGLKAEFDRERAEYRVMLEDALEAEAL